MSDARKRAEEALAKLDALCERASVRIYSTRISADADKWRDTFEVTLDAVRWFRAILAESAPPALPDGRHECHCCGARLAAGGPVFCAECYHANERPWTHCPDYATGQPHVDCPKCGGFGAVPAPPAADEVAEAAEATKPAWPYTCPNCGWEAYSIPGLRWHRGECNAALAARGRG